MAAKLRTIGQTNEFIARARQIFSPVAFRASILYFAVHDLREIDPMYQFSLHWFIKILVYSLGLWTQFKAAGEDKLGAKVDGKEALEKVFKATTQSLSLDEKIDLLNKGFTQELYRKLMIAIFEKDRKLVTYLITFRVLQAENFLDMGLTDFIIHGAKDLHMEVDVPEAVQGIEWIDGMRWAELKYLSTFKPFSEENLLGHFVEHQDEWV